MYRIIVSVAAAASMLAAATIASAQPGDRDRRGARDGGARAQPQRAAPQRAAPPPRAERRAPTRRAEPRAQRTPRAAERRREVQQNRAAERQRAVERRRAAQQRSEQNKRAAERRAEQRRAAEQRRSEQRRNAEQRRSEQRRNAEQQRLDRQRRSADRPDTPKTDRRAGADDNNRAERHKHVRDERGKLSDDQRTRLRNSFHRDRDHVSRVRFTARIGHRIPRSVTLYIIPAAVFTVAPYYRDYRYVVIDDDICIVDPVTYEIVDVLDTYPSSGPRPGIAQLTLNDSERALVLGSIAPDFPRADVRLRLALGAEIPRDVELHQFAPNVLEEIGRLSAFRLVVTQDQVVIVDPRNRDIALVLDR